MTEARGSRRLLVVLIAGLLVTAGSPTLVGSATAADGSFTTETYEDREYKLYTPSDYDGSEEVPVVVALHGCEQTPSDFAEGTQLNDVAETEGFIVVYPKQTEDANSKRCWNWFDTDHQQRGTGEPALIKGMLDQVKSNHNVDDTRVHAAGMSAGGAMTVILGAAYPHTFASIGSHSGMEYKAAESSWSALNAMDYGGPDPDEQGIEAYEEMDVMNRQVPTMVFHGQDDDTVDEVNGNQTAVQWAQTHDMADNGDDDDSFASGYNQKTSGVANGYDYTHYYFNDSGGDSLVEYYLVDELKHAWSGGDSAGSYTDSNGPNATQLMWEYFEDHPLQTEEQTLLVDDFEDNDGLEDYNEDAHESSPYLDDYFQDTYDDGGYDDEPIEGDYSLGSYSDEDEYHNVVHTYSSDSEQVEPNVLPQEGDTISYYTQTDYLDGYKDSADPGQVTSAFMFGVQDQENRYIALIDMADDEFMLLKEEGDSVSVLAAESGLGLDPKGHWYQVEIDWGESGDLTARLIDHEGDGSVVTEIGATDDTFDTGGIGFYKTGGPSDGLYSLAYWDNVTVTRPVN